MICLGYKGYVIKEYFPNYFLHMSDVTFDMRDNSMEVHQNAAEPWRVTLVDTGADTQTGGRLKRVADYVARRDVLLTYGDGVADVDIPRLLAFHRAHGKLATITAVQPPGRFGALQIDEDETVEHSPRPSSGRSRRSRKATAPGSTAASSCSSRRCSTGSPATRRPEGAPLESLAADGELRAYRHHGFWQPMDALRDLRALQALWDAGEAPWAVWKTCKWGGRWASLRPTRAARSSSPDTPGSRARGSPNGWRRWAPMSRASRSIRQRSPACSTPWTFARG